NVLHNAVSSKAPIRIVERLLVAGVHPNATDLFYQNTALHLAMADKQTSPEVIRLLVQSGSDVNARGMVSVGCAISESVTNKLTMTIEGKHYSFDDRGQF